MIPTTTTIPSAMATATAAATAWWVAPAVLAALLAFVGGIIALAVNGRRARIDRQRTVFADAYGDLEEYREFAYIVRRRRHDDGPGERTRISDALSTVQARLNRHRAVLRVEAPHVARAYATLLDTTRRVIGGAIHDGWNQPAITADEHIHVALDLSAVEADQDRYLQAVADHLALTPAWLLRALRWCRSRPVAAWRWAWAPVPAASRPT